MLDLVMVISDPHNPMPLDPKRLLFEIDSIADVIKTALNY
jgi:hypothetical protein